MKLFQKNLMASEDVKAYLGTGVFYASNAAAQVYDGAIVVVGDIMDHTVYAGLKDVNVRKLTAPAAVTDKVAIIDYVGISQGQIMNVNYREGIKTAGLIPQVGEEVRYRLPKVGDSFWLTAGCFEGTPAVGKFAGTTAGDTVLTIADSKPASGFAVKIETTKKLTEGAVDTEVQYFCTVVAE